MFIYHSLKFCKFPPKEYSYPLLFELLPPHPSPRSLIFLLLRFYIFLIGDPSVDSLGTSFSSDWEQDSVKRGGLDWRRYE